MVLWAGRFKKEVDKDVNAFQSSLPFDARMYEHDIKGSLAHAKMLSKQGIIDNQSYLEIQRGLTEILHDIQSGTLLFDNDAEDIHMFIESELTQRYPESGKKLHTARSRNDQVALDLRLYTRDEIKEIKHMLIQIILTIIEQAQKHKETIMCGYTHLQRAQPITFAHHLMSYTEMFYRDITRLDDCYQRMNVSPLGCGALATTTYPIDRYAICQELDMNDICHNSLDGVSDRDYAIELANDLSMIMMHLSRLSEEIILWCSWEFKYIELDDAYATGSSIMPQKKNPDIAELVRGKSGRVIGDLTSLLTMMKGLPLAYNKDMQEDKEALFDAIDTVKLCLPVFTNMIKTMKVNVERMRECAAKGFINATDCADYLVKRGKAFRDAYKITGKIVAYCIDHGYVLETLPLDIYQQYDHAFDKSIYEAIDLDTCVKNRNSDGGPSLKAVEKHIQMMIKKVDDIK